MNRTSTTKHRRTDVYFTGMLGGPARSYDMFAHISHGGVNFRRGEPYRPFEEEPIYPTTTVPNDVILVVLQHHDGQYATETPLMDRTAYFQNGSTHYPNGRMRDLSKLVLDRIKRLAHSQGFLPTLFATPPAPSSSSVLASNGWYDGFFFKTFHGGDQVPNISMRASHDRGYYYGNDPWTKMGLFSINNPLQIPNLPERKIWPVGNDPLEYRLSDVLARVHRIPMLFARKKIVFLWCCTTHTGVTVNDPKRKKSFDIVTQRKERRNMPMPPSKRQRIK
jgi:hypothetical protein